MTVEDVLESGLVFTLKRLLVILTFLVEAVMHHNQEVMGELSEFDLEPLGVLEEVPGQGVEIGQGLFPEHS